MANLVPTKQVALTFLNICWEFVTTLNYEWSIIRGRLPYRWTIWIYSFTRVGCLLGVILIFVGRDSSTPINCQLWVIFVSIILGLSVAGASLLIVLRIIVIWNRNKVATATAFSLWGIGIAFHIRAITRLRSTWNPEQHNCYAVPTKSGLNGLIPTVFADLTLLPILLASLILLRRRGGGTFGLSSLLWKQGVIWLLIAFMSEAPLAVIAVLSSNDAFLDILIPPGVIAMTIATTRMHRSLVDYASGSPDIVVENLELSNGTSFSKSKSIQAASISPPNQIEVTVHKAFEQHPTAQMNDHGSINSTNAQVHEKPSVWSLGEDVLVLERGLQKQVSVLESVSWRPFLYLSW